MELIEDPKDDVKPTVIQKKEGQLSNVKCIIIKETKAGLFLIWFWNC